MQLEDLQHRKLKVYNQSLLASISLGNVLAEHLILNASVKYCKIDKLNILQIRILRILPKSSD